MEAALGIINESFDSILGANSGGSPEEQNLERFLIKLHALCQQKLFFFHQQVFKAMELQPFQYDTFHRHARSFIEPAVIHHWKTLQDVRRAKL